MDHVTIINKRQSHFIVYGASIAWQVWDIQVRSAVETLLLWAPIYQAEAALAAPGHGTEFIYQAIQ